MSRTNIVPMQPPQNPLVQRYIETVETATTLLALIMGEVLDKLRKAEKSAIERLESYVPTEPLLKTPEAAAYLGFSKRWLDEHTRAGGIPEVPVIFIGGEKRFRKSSLDRYLENREIGKKKIRL